MSAPDRAQRRAARSEPSELRPNGNVIRFPAHRMRRDREPWVSKKEVAAYLGRSERWIEQQYRYGFPHHKDGPSRLVWFRLSEVDEFMNGRRAS